MAKRRYRRRRRTEQEQVEVGAFSLDYVEPQEGYEEEGEEVGVPDEAGNIEIVDQEPVEKQQLQVVPVPVGGIGEQVAVEDEKVQAVVEAVAALGVGEQEE